MQDLTAHIDKVYDWDWITHVSKISDRYTLNEAKNRFPSFYNWLMANDYTEDVFMNISECVCSHNDWIWKHHAAGYKSRCQSRSNTIWPHGKYNINFPIHAAFGKYKGQGTSAFFSGGTIGQGGSHLFIDHSNWQYDPAVRNAFMSTTWGDHSIFGYQESVHISGFRISGAWNDYNDPSFESSGIAIWDAGETSHIEHVYAESFNTDGFTFAKGTPVTVINCSAFHNKRFGFGGDGGALASYRLIAISGDNNGIALVGCRPGHTRVGGGNWTIIGAKMESYNEPNVFGKKADGMIFFSGEGYVTLTLDGLSIGNHSLYTDAIIVLKNLVNKPSVDVRNMRGYDYMNVLQIDGTRYTISNRVYGGLSWEYNSTGFYTNSGNVTINEGSDKMLWYLDRDPQTGQPVGSFDYVNGTPERVWQISEQPLPSCEWYTGAWSDCEGGEQSREVRLLQEPCQGDPGPEPASTRTCDLPPPGDSVNVLLVHNNITKANAYKAHYDQFDLYNIELLEYDVYNGSNLGCITNDSFNALKTTINTDHPTVEWVILLDERVFRAGQQNNFYGHNSITSALKSGIYEYEMTTSGTIIGPLRENPLWDYIGNKPFTDKGNRGYSLLSWDAFENNKNNFKGVETGLWWHWIYGNRGGYRKPTCQDAAQLPLVDGVNNLYEEFSGWENREVHDQQNVLTVVNGMYKFELDNTNTYKPGGIFSNLTSYGGCLNGKTPQNQPSDQTPITQLLKHGYAGAEGSIREPWVTGQTSGDTPAQFLHPVRLGERFFSGMSIQQIMHSSIQKDDLILIMGDPLYIPYGEYTPPTDVYGCTDPEANNFNPLATIDDGSCTYDPPPVDGLVWETNFADSDGKYLRSDQGDLGPFKYGLNWANEVSEEGMNVRDYNQWVECDIKGVNKVVLAADLTSMNAKAIFHTADSYLRWSGQKESFVIGVNNIECAHTYVDGVYTISLPLDCDLISLMGPNPMIGLWRYIRLLHTEI